MEDLSSVIQERTEKLSKSNNVGDLDLKINIVCLTAVLSIRIMYRLLMRDPLCYFWMTSPAYACEKYSKNADCFQDIPAGMLLALCDVESIIPTLADKLLKVSIACREHCGDLQELVLKSFFEHGLCLIFTLACVSDNGVHILSSTGSFERMLRSLCIRVQLSSIRLASSRQIFLFCAKINYLCSQREQLASKYSFAEILSKFNIFQFILRSLLICAHPYCLCEESQVASGNLKFIATERYESADSYYGLLAALWVLQLKPSQGLNILQNLEKSSSTSIFHEVQHESKEISLSSSPDDFFKACVTEYYVQNFIFCRVLAEKLFCHQSQESFHSDKPDGTLIGKHNSFESCYVIVMSL